jgi:uncharacterized iron-regulated protein
MIFTQSRKIVPVKMAVPVIALVFFCQLLVAGCAPSKPRLLKPLQPDETSQLAEKLSGARVVCIGEAHTAALHHKNQLEIIQGFHETGAKVTIGLEMFPFTSQPLLDNWINDSLSLEDFTKGYYQNWQILFAMYEDIFLYAQKEKIPLLGLNVPKSIAGRVARYGFNSLTSQEKENLPNNIICQPDTAQMVLLRNVLAKHGNNGALFQYFCEAHNLRDRTMALYAETYLEQNPDKMLVILAGIGHCVKQGTVDNFENISKERAVVILPAVSEKILKQPITSEIADYLLEDD